MRLFYSSLPHKTTAIGKTMNKICKHFSGVYCCAINHKALGEKPFRLVSIWESKSLTVWWFASLFFLPFVCRMLCVLCIFTHKLYSWTCYLFSNRVMMNASEKAKKRHEEIIATLRDCTACEMYQSSCVECWHVMWACIPSLQPTRLHP